MQYCVTIGKSIDLFYYFSNICYKSLKLNATKLGDFFNKLGNFFAVMVENRRI